MGLINIFIFRGELGVVSRKSLKKTAPDWQVMLGKKTLIDRPFSFLTKGETKRMIRGFFSLETIQKMRP